MSEKQDLKRMFAPFMRLLPLIIPVLIITGIISYRLCRYIVPMYETEIRVKLETKDDSFTRNNLYKDFDVLTASDKVLTEVQVLKSDLIILKTLRSMNLPVTYKRVGQLMNSEMYPIAPFIVEIDSTKEIKKDEYFGLQITESGQIELIKGEAITKGKLNQWIDFAEGRIKIARNLQWVNENGQKEMSGSFEFKVNTLRGLKGDFVDENLLVKEIDKDIDIIKIHFSGENPQKIADFANQLVTTFTKDYLETKVQAAELTSNFIDSQITDIKRKLINAEANLERFRYDKKILNSKQQLEIGLKKISQLDVQLANLSLKKITMDSLIVYVENESNDYSKYAPSFESYGGLLFVELMKKYQSLIDDRRKLSSQYTQSSLEIKEVNEKLAQTKSYIKNSIVNHRKLVTYQYDLLSQRVEIEKEKFQDLPTKERKFLVYEREFRQNEDIYNFLSKKKMEADIAKSVDLAFHKIIKVAQVPKMATSPNKKFITALVILSVFLVIVFLIYLVNFLDGRINSKVLIEEFFNHSVHTFLVEDKSKDLKFNHDLMTDIINKKNNPKIIAVASAYSGEGKTYFTHALVTTQKQLQNGKNAIITDANIEFNNCDKLSHEILNEWRSENYSSSYFKDYKSVLIDTSGIKFSKEEGVLLNHVDHVFFILKYKKTTQTDLEFIQRFLKTNRIKSYSLILNNYHPFSNYQGDINTSNSYKKPKKGIVKRLVHLKNWYSAWWAV